MSTRPYLQPLPHPPACPHLTGFPRQLAMASRLCATLYLREMRRGSTPGPTASFSILQEGVGCAGECVMSVCVEGDCHDKQCEMGYGVVCSLPAFAGGMFTL